MKTLLSVLILALLSGCMNIEKATSFLEKKGELPVICSKLYRAKDSLVVRKSSTIDTVYQQSIKFVDTCNGKISEKVCPPVKIIKETITMDTTIWTHNPAYETVLQSRIDEGLALLKKSRQDYEKLAAEASQLRQDLVNAKKDKADWRWKAIWTWIVVAGSIALTVLWRTKK